MGKSVNLSPLGLYNWDNTIFDLMQIPTALDRNTLINNLIAETAELEVLYPNPIVFKNLVGIWSAKQIDIWNKLYATTQYEYNPIENYDRYETGSTSGSGNTTHGGSDGTATGGSDRTTGNGTHGHWIAGFDSTPVGPSDDGLVKQTRDVDDVTSTTTYGRTETKTYGEEIETASEGEHELHAHGNIGTTTTQQLIQEQRAIDLFNLYDIIIADFKMRFCILIY